MRLWICLILLGLSACAGPPETTIEREVAGQRAETHRTLDGDSAGPEGASPGTSSPRVADSIADLVAAQRALAPYGSKVGDAPDVFQIPAAARPLFADLEHAWERYLREQLQVIDLGAAERTIANALLNPLKRRGVKQGYEAQAFGALLAVWVQKHAGDVLGVVVSSTLDCSPDDTLFLFSTAGGQVQRLATVGAKKRVSLADGQLGLEYALVPTSGGTPEIVVASATPWCASAWRTLRYEVLSMRSAAARPRASFRHEASVWIGNGTWELQSGDDWFQIRHDTWDTVGSSVVAGRVARYTRSGGRWSPTTPRLSSAADVIHAWAALPPPLARELVLPEARAAAADLHAAFRRNAGKERGYVQLTASAKNENRLTFECEDCRVLPKHLDLTLTRVADSWRISNLKTAEREQDEQDEQND